MSAPCERYLDQTRQVRDLCRPQTWPGLPRAELLTRVRARTGEIRALRADNTALLHSLVLDRDPAALTAQEAEQLLGFADRLLTYARHLDTGAAYAVHGLLYRYAKLHGDEPLAVREAYNRGLTLHYLNLVRREMGVNLFGEEITGCFTEGAACLARFAQLDDATRDYGIRCLGNVRLDNPAVWGGNSHRPHPGAVGDYAAYARLFDETMAVINSAEYRALAPDLPWNRYAYAMHYARTAFLTALRVKPEAAMARDVLASAEFVYQWQMLEKGDTTGRFLSADTRYRYAAARYHAGQLSGEGLLRQILSLRNTVAADDYSANGMMVHMRLPYYAKSYLNGLAPDAQARFRPAVEEWLEDCDRYLRAAPANEFADAIDELTGRILDSRLGQGADRQTPVLEYLLWRHPPTYVHANMVAYLARRLVLRAAQAAPEALRQHAGTADAEVLAQKAYSAGLYHDIGKCMLLQVVGLYSRALLPEEHAQLRCHPLLGWNLLRRFPALQDEAMAALWHHYRADGTDGYPQDIPPLPAELRWLAEVVAAADSIDAATDDIGRSYAEAKPFAVLFDELRAGRGTRYAEWVAALFDDADFCAALAAEAGAAREEIYCRVYSGAAEPQR